MDYLESDVDPAAYDGDAAGKTLRDGRLVQYTCQRNAPIDGNNAYDVTYEWIPNGEATPPTPPLPPPDPAELAANAAKTLTMPTPQMHWGPLPDQAVVHSPLWFWIDEPGPVGTSVSLRGVTVTMSATIDTVTWHTGEPTTNPDEGQSPQVTVRCDGLGEPPPPADQLAQIPAADRHPPCGYAYQWKSTPERTGGAGTWPLNAEATWTLAWTSNTGAGGSFTLHSTATARIEVLELNSVLVAAPSGPPR